MKLYDTLSGAKHEFHPLAEEVKLYVCGPTPYAEAHLGHAMSYVTFDVLRRYLEYRGYRVRHVQNFTDIDDKLIQRAAETDQSVGALAERYIQEFLEDMDTLRVQRAHEYPWATREIPYMVEMIQALVEKGVAYAVGGDVYFRVQKVGDYGKLSHRTLEGMMAGARVEVGQQKGHPMDFVLWKAAKPGEPSWDSPWGPGRPGWHIECSVMSHRYLGERVDIHGGGLDLVFPHHENEIAQTEAFTGVKPFVRFWVHNGLLQLDEVKMSKSLRNFVTVRVALERHGADALRLFFLGSHYRSPLAYSEERIAAAARSVERLREALRLPGKAGPPVDVGPYVQRFLAAMDDDLNTPQALAALFDLAREINRGREGGQDVAPAQERLRELAGVLGLTLESGQGTDHLANQGFIELLVETRGWLRQERRFDLADRLRQRMGQLGVVIEDTPEGASWKFRTPAES